MADWSLPTLTSGYSDFLTYLKDRDNDSAKMFDGVSSNLLTGTIRWSSANNRFEKYNGTSWDLLTSKILMNVDTLDGTTVDDSAAASTGVLWTSNKISTTLGNYYLSSTIDTMLTDYILKNGNNGTLTLGTNDNSSVNIETNNVARWSISGTGNVNVINPTAGVALTLGNYTGQNSITASGAIQASYFKSTIATGTAPFTVASTTKVSNLNADLLDGLSSGDFLGVSAKAVDSDKLDSKDSTYFMGLNAGSSTVDPNTTAEQFILTNHANSPDSIKYWHIRTQFYVSITGTSNRAQIAIEYNAGTYARTFVRSYYSDTGWSAWLHLAGITDNVASATKLATIRTINGVNFNGTANITVYDSSKLPLTGGALTGALTTNSTIDGRDVSADGSKLDGIASGAQVNVATNLSATAGTTAGPTINSSTGNNVVIPSASGTASGIITTAAQTFVGIKTFLSTIAGNITGNAGTATKLATGRTISLTGDATGTSAAFDGSGNASIAVAIVDDSHNHITSNIDGLDAALSGKLVATNYATSTAGGTIKARISGSTLYLRIDGTDA